VSATSVAALLRARAGDSHPGYVFDDCTWSWDDVVDESCRRAAMLAAVLDDRRPLHVGVLLDNVPEYLFVAGGAALAGATVVGINPTRRGAELTHDVAHTDCQVVITDDAGAATLPDDIGVPIVTVESPGYGALLADQRVTAVPALDPEQSTPLFLLFTSGSTSAPKAVVCSTGRMALTGQRAAAGYGITRNDVCYCAMPLFHGNALMACWAPALAVGATVVLRRRFTASGFLHDVRHYGCTYFTYVGRSIAYILSQAPSESDRDHRLRLGFGTEASALDRQRFHERFGCPLVEGYGSSESVVVIMRTPDTPPNALGRPRLDDGSDVAVVDPETGVECPRARFTPDGRLANLAAIGELVNRAGGGAFEGYYRHPEATSDRLRGGWYWTGDLAYVDEAGFFWFAGRSSDWLRVDSENFAAAPVERVLHRFPGVVMVAVYAVPDPRTGDQVMAALEIEPGSTFDPGTFAAFLASQPDLGTKWAPRFVRVVDSMPLTANNKVHKNPLRDERWRTADPVWWRPRRELAYERFDDDARRAYEAEFVEHGRSTVIDAP
jgi:fatty-acyl-CoA synthase